MTKSAIKPKKLAKINKAHFKRMANHPAAITPFTGIAYDLEEAISRHIFNHDRYERYLSDTEWITRAPDEQYLFFWLLVAKAEDIL